METVREEVKSPSGRAERQARKRKALQEGVPKGRVLKRPDPLGRVDQEIVPGIHTQNPAGGPRRRQLPQKSKAQLAAQGYPHHEWGCTVCKPSRLAQPGAGPPRNTAWYNASTAHK